MRLINIGARKNIVRWMPGIALGLILALMVEVFDLGVLHMQATKTQFCIHLMLLWVFYSPIIVVSFFSSESGQKRLEILKSIGIGFIVTWVLTASRDGFKIGTSLIVLLLLLVCGTFWNIYKQNRQMYH